MIISTKAECKNGVVKLQDYVNVVGIFDVNEFNSILDRCKSHVNRIEYNHIKESLSNFEHPSLIDIFINNGEVTNIRIPKNSFLTNSSYYIQSVVCDVYNTTAYEMEVYSNSRKTEHKLPRRAFTCCLCALGLDYLQVARLTYKKSHATVIHALKSAYIDLHGNYANERENYSQISEVINIDVIKFLNKITHRF